jgi:transitional endoplasmic reticulum ATPase
MPSRTRRIHLFRAHAVTVSSRLSGVAKIEQDSGGYGTIARVRKVIGRRIFIQISNGNLGWIDHDGSLELEEGQIIFVFTDHIDEAPEDLWPEELQISVVRIKNDEFTVLEYAGQIRCVPTTNIDYTKGNTVEFLPSGVIRVLDTMPLSLLELPDITDATIQDFKVDTATDNISFEDFEGLPHIVARARKLIETPLKYRDRLAVRFPPRSGHGSCYE